MSDGKGEGAIKDENVGVNINLLNDMMSAMRVMQETLNNATIMKEAHGVNIDLSDKYRGVANMHV